MRTKLLGFILCVASMATTSSYASAGTSVSMSNTSSLSNTANPQWRDWRRDDRDWQRRYRDRDRSRVRVEYRTQVVRRGWAVYRETYEVRYLPNGRVMTSLVDRDRIR